MVTFVQPPTMPPSPCSPCALADRRMFRPWLRHAVASRQVTGTLAATIAVAAGCVAAAIDEVPACVSRGELPAHG